MLMPCWPKKVGSQFTKPKISVLTVTSTTQPTISRGNRVALNSEPNVYSTTGAAGRGGGSALPPEASRSISCISASASAVLPLASSQRGLSGSFLRRYQTTSAPTPAMANIGRQPLTASITGEPKTVMSEESVKPGITKVLIIEVAGKPATTTKAMNDIHRPRE